MSVGLVVFLCFVRIELCTFKFVSGHDFGKVEFNVVIGVKDIKFISAVPSFISEFGLLCPQSVVFPLLKLAHFVSNDITNSECPNCLG